MAGPAKRRRRADTAGIPRHVLTARAAVVEEGDEGPDAEVERRPDQEERHVEERLLPAQQRIVLGRARDRPRVEIVQAEEQRDEESRHHGERCEDRLADPPQHDPPSSLGARTGSARRRARRGPGSERTGTTRATRRRTASDSPRPRIAQATAPSRAHAAPMAGRRFHECPGGIVACSGRSATRSRSDDHSGLQELDASCAQRLQQLPGGRRIEPRDPTIRSR